MNPLDNVDDTVIRCQTSPASVRLVADLVSILQQQCARVMELVELDTNAMYICLFFNCLLLLSRGKRVPPGDSHLIFFP